ncbi:MAG: hypothetical protein AAF961_16455 [Planctomycetota bacterium]
MFGYAAVGGACGSPPPLVGQRKGVQTSVAQAARRDASAAAAAGDFEPYLQTEVVRRRDRFGLAR